MHEVAKRFAKSQGRAGFVVPKQFAELGLPNILQRQSMKHPSSPGVSSRATKWRRIAKDLPRIERELSAWEERNPEAYRSMPWYEERERFKAQKAAGEVRWPEWWEIAGACAHTGHVITKFKP